MRHIAALSDEKMPPRDDEFKFRARAKGLVDKWHQILNANKPNTTGSPSVAQANGKVVNDEKTEAESENKKEEGADADAEADAEVTQGTKNLDINGKGAFSLL